MPIRLTHIALSLLAAGVGLAQSRAVTNAYVIDTVAGSDTLGDGAPAATAQLLDLQSVAADRQGNVYISDAGNHRIRKVLPSGVITTVAGNGFPGYRGDGGPAQAAQLNLPYGLAVDVAGNLYVADLGNHRIRKITPDGTISTFAGNGEKGSNGDGGPAASAQLMSPRNVALDNLGNLFISEFEGHRVRKVSSDGVITTVAGTGVSGFRGDNGPASAAQLASPAGLAIAADGTLYMADSGNHRIRMVYPGGIIVTLLGSEGHKLYLPTGLALDTDRSLYIADQSASVRRWSLSGNLAVAAGTGEAGYSGDLGPATAARIAHPRDITVDLAGNLYIAGGNRVRKVSMGMIQTFAGDGFRQSVGDGKAATQATLSRPGGLSRDADGNLYIADTGTQRIRVVTAQGTIATLAGNGDAGSGGDGNPAALAQLNSPSGVAVDAARNVFIADSANHRVRVVLAAGWVRTFAGTGEPGASDDGVSSLLAPLRSPGAVATDASGNLYIADTANHRIVRVGPDGKTVSAATKLNGPRGLALDRSGSLYIADTGNHSILKFGADGKMARVAGTGVAGAEGDGGPAMHATLSYPEGVAVDSAGVVYVADTGNHRLRRIGTDGVITTIAGTGAGGFSGDRGAASQAQLLSPTGILVDSSGAIFFSDSGNNRVRKLTPLREAPGAGQPAQLAVLHAATLLPGPVAPGEIVSIFGTAIGPDKATGANITPRRSG